MQGPLVENRYDFTNGFVDMKRDVILRLCKFLSSGTTKEMFGMCEEIYLWKNHDYFLAGRPTEIVISFLENPRGRYSVTSTPEGLFCKFPEDCVRTVFVDKQLSDKIYRWIVAIEYAKKGESYFWIGAAPADRLKEFNQTALGYLIGSTFIFSRDRRGSLKSGIVADVNAIPWLPTPVPAGATVAIEADCAGHTLCFFVNGRKIPRGFKGVRVPLHVGMSGCNSSFTSLSFLRLSSNTPSAVACRYYDTKESPLK